MLTSAEHLSMCHLQLSVQEVTLSQSDLLAHWPMRLTSVTSRTRHFCLCLGVCACVCMGVCCVSGCVCVCIQLIKLYFPTTHEGSLVSLAKG